MELKKKRKVNKALTDSYHNNPCVVCGSRYGTHGHHMKTKGSGGDDIVENLISLCFNHHCEIGQIGIKKFIKKYPWVEKIFREKGWEIIMGKWKRGIQ